MTTVGLRTGRRAGSRRAAAGRGPTPGPGSAEPAADALRAQLTGVRGLLAVSLVMMERRREHDVLHLAATAVPGLAPCRTLGVHLGATGWAEGLHPGPDDLASVESAVAGCPVTGGPLDVAGHPWAWAFPLRSLEELIGHLVVGAREAPSPAEVVLLRSLAQQTGVAVANARLHASREAANATLARTVTTLERKTAIHDRLTEVALAGGGHEGIVRALHELTGLAAAVEDRTGRVLAWAGPRPVPGVHAEAGATGAGGPLADRALRGGRPVRVGDRLLAVARPRHDVVGVLVLHYPERRAGEAEVVALEHGATVLAIELARMLGVAETELRLGVDVVADLVGGTDVAAASRRAAALGRDLLRPHRVVLVTTTRPAPEPDALLRAVRSAAAEGRAPLLMPRGDGVVVLVEVASAEDRAPLHALVAGLRSSAVGRSTQVGAGGVCSAPEGYARSYREAQLALRLPDGAGRPQVVVHDDLGVYQLLSEVADVHGVDAFVRRWLGPLLDQDERRGSDLVRTLAHFLDTGGRYEAAAASLAIGRSTLRYRLGRIRDLSGHDLTDPEARFQLHLACKAWATRRALAGP